MSRPEFPLAEALYARFADDIVEIEHGAPNAFMEQVTPVTAELLRYWFQNDYRDNRDLNFHRGQRDAILSVVYAHEVVGARRLQDLYSEVAPHALIGSGRYGDITHPRNDHPKYAAKMATGTGKTWVLNALLIWQHLNHQANPQDDRFTSNFLIVAPGLIVYDRLLDSFQGRLRGETRDFATSDIHRQQDLFVPDDYRQQVFAFLQSSTVTKKEIGRKVTGSGVVAITNWHLLAGAEKESDDFLGDEAGDLDGVDAPGREIDVKAAVRELLPLTPGIAAGNALETLDRRHLRGGPIEALIDLPDLMVFNDEAHHIHTTKKGGEVSEVEWQRSLSLIAEPKGHRFIQVDFSATPFNETGSGKNKGRQYFDHIVVDFDLDVAMKEGLVKALALDKRDEIAALQDLDFRAERDGNRVIGLSEGQRVMLRAGLAKLRILEQQFAAQNPDKHPKLLVVCEDTTVVPFVEEFFAEAGLAQEDVLRVDSRNKAELGPREWEVVRERLFDVDRHQAPKVIISVLMLREGFDVNNICVIVPLRASGSGILLEQTIGRGLRLMWRGEGEAVDELKRQTRERISRRLPPENFLDLLFIVEHPAFQEFYESRLGAGVVGAVGGEADGRNAVGDLERVELREGYERFDFEIPVVLREASEELSAPRIDPSSLPVSRFPIDDLITRIGRGDRFASFDAQNGTRYGDYRVDGGVLTATGYNDFLARITNRVTQAFNRAFVSARKQYNEITRFPALQTHKPLLVGWIDDYIRHRMFGREFDPLDGENWRVLMVPDVAEELCGVFGTKLVELDGNQPVHGAEVYHRLVSEVPAINLRQSTAVIADKCIYPRLRVPARGGGLERLFIDWLNADSGVEAFVKIDEYKHDFLRRAYLKADGMPARYSPDFLVRTASGIHVVETKADSALSDENVTRKERAALAWVDQLNELAPADRSDREWSYVILSESAVTGWRERNASVTELLDYARLRHTERRERLTLFDERA